MRTAKTLLLLLLLVTALAPHRAAGAASPWETNPQSSVRLVTPWQVAPRDGEVHLGIHFKLAPGWHVYWKNSGDAGFPPVVDFGKTAGFRSAELLWPAPQRFELRGGLVAFGYETEVVYPVRAVFEKGETVPGDRLRLSADLDYLVCEVDCIPYRYTLTADQALGDTPVPDPETAPLVDAWWKRLPVAADSLAGVTTSGVLEPPAPGGSPTLVVQVQGAHPAAGTAPGLFLEAHDTFDAGRPEVRTTGDGVVFRVPLKPHEIGKPLPKETVFAWTVTGLGTSLEAKRTVTQGTAPAAQPAARTAGGLGGLARPIPGALLAVAATLAALWLWGLLGSASSGAGREALGFAAAAVMFGALWGLSRQVSFVGLAWIELLLLTMALCAWLRRRAARRRMLSFLLALGLAVCAVAAPWLAHLNRLT